MSTRESNPLFTVIIPTKDRAPYLYHTLRTCAMQEYENLEIIVSDDGSTDDTRAIVDEAARKDSRIRYVTPGAGGGTPTVNGANQGLTSGWAQTSNILTQAWSNTVNVLNVGDIVTFAGCNAVNPQNRKQYGGGRLRQFVVRPFVGTPSGGTFNATTGAYTSSGAGALQFTVSPAIITAGQFQNVSASPTNAGAVVIFGAGFTGSSPQNLAIHRNSFTLASADLPLPGGVVFAGRAADAQTGLSIRVVRQYTINNDSVPCRFDTLIGWAPIYPELSVRAAG